MMTHNMADFEKAFEKLMALEGGYVAHTKDPGGETKFGITKRSYPNLNIKTLTMDEAKVIYLRDWWTPHRYGEMNDQELAEKVFCLAVNIGPHHANKLLQRAVNKVESAGLNIDGIIGPKTLAAINGSQHRAHILAELKLLAVQYYLELGVINFLAGWIRRAIA